MRKRATKPPLSRRRRLARFAVCVVVGLALAVPLYVGLAKSGLIRSPFFPRVDGDLALAQSDRSGLRVLFVGNSFTYYHSMPALVHELAEHDAGARPIFAVEYTAPNWSLREASKNDGLLDLLHEVQWDYVVLQDVSWLPSAPPEVRHRDMDPFVYSLRRDIVWAEARPVLFMTWGYEDGDRHYSSADTYEAMQARLDEGYSELGEELFTPVAPVGLAWAEAQRRQPNLDLWSYDGRHPGASGSYLTACVFYAMLSGRNPSGSSFTAELEPADARFLQGVAFDVVRATTQ